MGLHRGWGLVSCALLRSVCAGLLSDHDQICRILDPLRELASPRCAGAWGGQIRRGS